jgi:hypothetical protein
MRIRAVVWIIAVTVALVAMAAGIYQYCQRQLVQQWEDQLQAASDAELRPLMQRAADQGPWGVRRVVEAMKVSRPGVAWAARDVLIERLQTWKLAAPEITTPLVESLVETLAEQTEGLSSPLQAVAADLATQVLRLPLAASTVRRDRVMACCEKILRAKGQPSDKKESTPVETPPLPKLPDLAASLNIGGLRSGVSGGGLPIEVFTPPSLPSVPNIAKPASLPRDTMESSMLADRPVEPAPKQVARAESETLQVLTSLTPLVSPGVPVMEAGLPAPMPKGDGRRLSLAEARAGFDRRMRRAVSNEAMVVGTGEVRELIRQVYTGDEATSARARAVLTRYGFTETLFALARQLSDSNPAVRQDLARSLVSMTGVDAAPWLLWLADDEDAEVRLTAITLMASSGTPDLVAHAEQLANRDSDPRIRRQAEQIERLRR